MGHQVIKLQNPLKTLGFLQFYRFKTVKDRIIPYSPNKYNFLFLAIPRWNFPALCLVRLIL